MYKTEPKHKAKVICPREFTCNSRSQESADDCAQYSTQQFW